MDDRIKPLDNWAKLAPQLDALLTLTSAARSSQLAEIAVRDPALASQLSDLLADHEAASRDGFLAGVASPGLPASTLSAGDRVGAWTLLSPLGEGGMGRVWRARRSDGRFEGEAAVKLLKAGLADSAAQERFRREGALLARLHHPGIAALLDAGLGPHGVPYLVLELVQGQPIDAWCAARPRSVRERVQAFVQVVDAVAAAHAQLVLHRDLKPSNILVEESGRVRLLDFGIGRLLHEEAVDDATLTAVGALALTARYAAPEQFEAAALTTATDVYQLGLVLYELLAGAHASGLAQGAMADYMRWAERDATPLASTTALRAGGADAAARASALRGDLDTILSKALKREAGARYASAAALAEDLRRYLARQPISARPDTLGYRATRWVQRNRALAAVACLAVLGVGGGVAATLVQSREALAQAQLARLQQQAAEQANTQAQRERANAQASQASAEAQRAEAEQQRSEAIAQRRAAESAQAAAEAERERANRAQRSAEGSAETARRAATEAEAERRNAEQALAARAATSEFMDLVLSEGVALNRPMTVVELLERAERMAEANFADRPEHLAPVRHNLGAMYGLTGNLERSRRLLAQAAAQAPAVKDPATRAMIECEYGEIQLLTQDFTGARRTLEDALRNASNDPLARFMCLRLVLRLSRSPAAWTQAAAEMEAALQRYANHPRVPPPVRWGHLGQLAVTYYQDMGRAADADRVYSALGDEIERAGRGRGAVARIRYNNHGMLLQMMGDSQRSLVLLQRAVAAADEGSPDGLPTLPQSLNLARALHTVGRSDEALLAMAPLPQRFAGSAYTQRVALGGLIEADIRLDIGDVSGARDALARAQPELLAAARRPPSVAVLNLLAAGIALSSRFDLAEGRAEQARQRVATELSNPRYVQQFDSVTFVLHFVHAQALLQLGDSAAALIAGEAALAQARAIQDKLPHSSRTARALALLARIHEARGDATKARSLREDAARQFATTVDATQHERAEVERLLRR